MSTPSSRTFSSWAGDVAIALRGCVHTATRLIPVPFQAVAARRRDGRTVRGSSRGQHSNHFRQAVKSLLGGLLRRPGAPGESAATGQAVVGDRPQLRKSGGADLALAGFRFRLLRRLRRARGPTAAKRPAWYGHDRHVSSWKTSRRAQRGRADAVITGRLVMGLSRPSACRCLKVLVFLVHGGVTWPRLRGLQPWRRRHWVLC